MKLNKFPYLSILSAVLFSSKKTPAEAFTPEQLTDYNRLIKRESGFDRGEHFYKHLPMKRVKGKWRVKK